jgi:cytochrome c-type biogenesis protein CcmH
MRKQAKTKRGIIPSIFAISLLLALLVVIGTVSAQDSTGDVTDDQVNAIAKELYCPVCESTPLDVCATQACADWREVIRTKLAEGQSGEEIKAYFELQYGPRALAEPPRQGFTLAIWILPIIAVIVGGLIFVRYVRSLRTVPLDAGPITVQDKNIDDNSSIEKPKPESENYRDRVERELREM